MEEIKSMVADLLSTQRRQFSMINCKLNEIKTGNQKIEQSIDFLFKQSQELQKKITDLEIQVRRDREYINMLRERTENLQWGGRKTCLEQKIKDKDIRDKR